jgi:hypothetical protein
MIELILTIVAISISAFLTCFVLFGPHTYETRMTTSETKAIDERNQRQLTEQRYRHAVAARERIEFDKFTNGSGDWAREIEAAILARRSER